MGLLDGIFDVGAVEETITSAVSGSLGDIFEEEPVPLDVFIQDKKYLGNPPLSQLQSEVVERAEKIYFPETYDAMALEFDPYWINTFPLTNFINVMFGKGAGKDHLCRITSLRVAYLLMCLKSPLEYYGMPEQDDIHLLNVARSADQARTAFFNPITKVVKKGWFKDKCDPTKGEIHFDKNIIAISGHSDGDSQEGLNLMLGVADEVDAFRTKNEVARYRGASARESMNTAEAILSMMASSGASRFPQVHKQMRISYPRYLGSTIMTLVANSKRMIEDNPEGSRHFASGPYATWEVNPLRNKEDFQSFYDEDPVDAAAKFECKPSFAQDPYFANSVAVDSCLIKKDPPLRVDYTTDGHSWRPKYEFSEDFFPVAGACYSLHADLATKGDRAGICLSHIVRYDSNESVVADETGTEYLRSEKRPIAKVDFVIGFEADVNAKPTPREIQISWVRDLCFLLQSKGFKILQFTFDNWQSTDSIQFFKSKGIDSYVVSADKTEEPYRTMRDLVYESRVTIPHSELLRKEILSLSKRNGKIDHPQGGSKDLSDAVACSLVGAIKLGGQEALDGSRAYYVPKEFTVIVDDASFMPKGLDMSMLLQEF